MLPISTAAEGGYQAAVRLMQKRADARCRVTCCAVAHLGMCSMRQCTVPCCTSRWSGSSGRSPRCRQPRLRWPRVMRPPGDERSVRFRHSAVAMDSCFDSSTTCFAFWPRQHARHHNLSLPGAAQLVLHCLHCNISHTQTRIQVRPADMYRFAAASPSKAARGGGGLLSNGHPAAAPAELEPQLLRRSSATLDSNANGSDMPQSARTRGPSRSDGALHAYVQILGAVY